MLFGTDSSFFPRGWQRPVYEQQKAIVESIGTSEADAALIFGGNFDQVVPCAAGSRQPAAGSEFEATAGSPAACCRLTSTEPS